MPDHKVYRDENGDYLIRASGLNDFFIHTVDDAEPPQPSPSASSPPPSPTATPVTPTPTPSTSSPPFIGNYDAGYYCVGSPTDVENFPACRPGACMYHSGGGFYTYCNTILGPYATEAECASACSGGATATPTTTPTTTSTPTPT